MRAQLLFALSSGGTPAADGRHEYEPHRVPLHFTARGHRLRWKLGQTAPLSDVTVVASIPAPYPPDDDTYLVSRAEFPRSG